MKKNSYIILAEITSSFFVSLFSSIKLFWSHLLGKKVTPLKENRFLDILNFLLHTGPKGFWKKPTGIKIGRSVATFLHYIFHKEEHFREQKK